MGYTLGKTNLVVLETYIGLYWYPSHPINLQNMCKLYAFENYLVHLFLRIVWM